MTPLVVIVGPTASGKSALGIELARRLDGEIINADSMQLYRGMDIGTAKVTPAETGEIPHHLLDVLEVTSEASVAAFQEQARQIVEQIRSRGRTPIMVGGSGLYVRAAIDVIEFPPTDPQLRTRLTERLQEEGAAALRLELRAADPESAAVIKDDRRLVRALEVVQLTGRTFSSFMPQRTYEPSLGPVVQLASTWTEPCCMSASPCGCSRWPSRACCRRCRRWKPRGCGRAGLLRAPSGTSSSFRFLTGRSTKLKPWSPPLLPPESSPDARRPGSVRIHASAG